MRIIFLPLLSCCSVLLFANGGCGGAIQTSSADGDAGPGGGATDAPLDRISLSEAGPRPRPEAGTVVDDPPDACAPGDVSSFAPTWAAPAPFAQKRCSNAQVDALLCLFDSNADYSLCDAISKDPANKDCSSCIFTSVGSGPLGPVVIDGELGSLNLAGCIANASGDLTANGCGAKVQAADQCADEACDPNCPIDSDPDSFDRLFACQEQARQTVCGDFADAAGCADTLSAAAPCSDGNDFLERAAALAKLFCGGRVDGGADATGG